MTGAIIGYTCFVLGAIFGLGIFALLNASKDPPKPHTTCKDCVHRNQKECPFSRFTSDVTGNAVFWITDKSDDFYCKEAQNIELGTKRK